MSTDSEEKETKVEEKVEQEEGVLRTVSDALTDLLGSESFADVHFLVKTKDGKEERIPAHRTVLAARNIIFQSLLFSVDFKNDTFNFNTSKNNDKDIVIEGIHPDSFRKMLKAIYCDEVEITADDHIDDLIALAKQFQVDALRMAVVGSMEDEVNAENACKKFEDGRKLFNEATFGFKYIEENATDVFASEDFENLSREGVSILLKSNNLCIDEADVVKAVMRWATAECKRQDKKPTTDNKREMIGDMVHNIRFTEMSMNDIVSTVQSTGLLGQEDLLALYTYVGASKDNKPKTKFNTKPREGGGYFVKSAILDPKQQKILADFYSKEKKPRWKRIFHGKTDGMNSSSFHAKVGSTQPTISIIKSTNGNIFGGYCNVSWSNGNYVTDGTAWLFSLKNSFNKPVKLISTSDSYSVYAYSSYGPTFGGGHCICIHSDFTGNSNYCNYYASYRVADTSCGITYDSSNAATLFGGSYNFQCSDVEVYTLDK